MSMSVAIVVAMGLIAYAVVTHRLAVLRAERFVPHAPDDDIGDLTEETRMTLSQQQLRTLALNYVRRAIIDGTYTDIELDRWRTELGADVVDDMLPAKKPKRRTPSPTTPASPEE